MKTRICSMLSLLAVSVFASAASADFVVFDNDFNGAWTSTDGTEINATGATFSNDSDANGAVWEATVTPIDLISGGISFTRGAAPTGRIETTFEARAGFEYEVDYSAVFVGAASTNTLFVGLAGGGPTQSFTGGESGTFSFSGTGADVTLRFGVQSVDSTFNNIASDVSLSSVTVTAIPEPTTFGLGMGIVGLAFFRRRRIA